MDYSSSRKKTCICSDDAQTQTCRNFNTTFK